MLLPTPSPQDGAHEQKKQWQTGTTLTSLACENILGLTATVAANGAALHLLELGFQLLDLSVSLFEILVEAVALGNELLLPLSESLLLDLDLFGETFAQGLLFLLEFGVVQLARTGFAELARLHLLSAISLIMQLLGSVNKVQHVGSDQDGAQLLKVTVFFVFHLGNTPAVLAALDDATIAGFDILLGTNDGEGHGGHKASGVLSGSFVVLLDRGLVDFDVLGLDNGDNLE